MLETLLTLAWVLGTCVVAFGSDPPKAPPPQPPPDTGAADAAAAAERDKSQKRRGRNPNVLTSPTGDANYAALGGGQQQNTSTTKAKLGA